MSSRNIAIVVLAAGKGTRMKSDLHKVLHPIAGRPMLLHLLAAADTLSPQHTVVVTGAGREQVEAAVAPLGARIAVQGEQLGTGHAVMQAEEALRGFEGDVLILYGDVPLVRAETMHAMVDRLNADDAPAVVVLGFRPPDPGAYGRLIVAAGSDRLEKIVEFKDADAEERLVTLCNSGLMAVRGDALFALLARLKNENAAGEYYLTDIVELSGHAAVIEADAGEVAGVNSRGELARVEAAWQQERRARAMADGVTLIAPETVWFSHDTVLGRNVIIEPNVVFGAGVTVADGATIHAFSHVEGATIGARAQVGPFARLRPGAVLGADAKVGNFVEIKKADIGVGAKVSHLTYIGDAEVGPDANIGAGTITCNYDGFFKYRTKIGEGAFVGSNSALVAPVTIGAGAIVAAGSVVVRDVTPDSLALARGRQEERGGWAKRFRDAMMAKKKGQ